MPTDPFVLLSAWDWPAVPTIETADSEWALWGVAYAERDQQVDTKWGTRVDRSHRVLLIFGGDSVAYRQPAESAVQPAKKSP